MKATSSQARTADELGAAAAGGIFARGLLRALRWLLTTTWFLMLLALLFVGISLYASFITGAWHWFQRSGALMVSIGAVLSTQRALGVILDCMLEERRPAGSGAVRPTANDGYGPADMRELKTCVCGFMLVAAGTLVWSYGDLLGCLLYWNTACL